MMSDWRSVSIDFVELSTRAIGALGRNGITTVGQIDDMTDAQMRRLRGVGRDTFRHIREAVDQARARYHETGYPPQRDRERYASPAAQSSSTD